MPLCPECKDGALTHSAELADGEEKDERTCDDCGEAF